jgi:hypothetical protein
LSDGKPAEPPSEIEKSLGLSRRFASLITMSASAGPFRAAPRKDVPRALEGLLERQETELDRQPPHRGLSHLITLGLAGRVEGLRTLLDRLKTTATSFGATAF